MLPSPQQLSPLITAFVIFGAVSTVGAETTPLVDREKLAKIKGQLVAYHDGKGHFFVVPFPPERATGLTEHCYYGDGKIFYRQHARTASRYQGQLSVGIVDPRIRTLTRSSFSFTRREGTLRCEDRKTRFTPLEPAKARQLVDEAVFREIYWRRIPHLLARDDDGRYYYVDRLKSAPGSSAGFRGVRLFAGPRGQLKRLKLKDVITDPSGEIFLARSGKLKHLPAVRGTHGPRDATAWWHAKGKRRTLTVLPMNTFKTGLLIFRHLGVYQGQRMHRPCDDL